MKNTLSALQERFLQTTKKIPLQIVVFGQTLLIILLILVLPAIFLAFKNNKGNVPQASSANGTALLTLSPATTRLTPNSPHTVEVFFNTGADRVDGVQAIINFTGTVPNDVVFVPSTVAGLSPVVTNVENVTGGKKASLAFITSNPQQPFTTNSSQVKLGQFTFTSPASGTLNVQFNTQFTTSIKNGTTQDILKTPENAVFTFAFAGNDEPSLSFNTLTPPNPQVIGSTFQVNVVANSGTRQLSGVDAQIAFDPSLVEIVSIEQATQFPAYPELTYDNQTGRAYISANIGTAANATPVSGASIAIAKITGRTKAATESTSLSFVFNANDRNDSNLVLYIAQQGQEPADVLAKVENQSLVIGGLGEPTELTPTPQATAIPTATRTPTPTVTPANSAANTVRFALQGKNRPEANKTAQLSVNIQSTQNSNVTSATVSTNTAGQAQLSIVPGDYILLAKTPGYLARKIGTVANPVRLNGSTTPIDLSSTPLLGGDFNDDDEVNEIDYTLRFLTSFRESDPVVDLDNSGNVNNLDFAIMRSNWAQESDTL
jgi:hypothetical protein